MKEFSSNNDFKAYLKEKGLIKKGSGSEGSFYYSWVDKKGYKIFNQENLYKPELVIMDDEVQIESYIFPEELLVIDGKLKGYTSRIIKNNILSDSNLENFNLGAIDFTALKMAYKLFKIETALLANKGIAVFDLANNLVFDGKRIYAVDTCCYYKTKDKWVLRHNDQCLNDAIDSMLEMIFLYADVEIKSREELGLTVSAYFDYIIKKLQKPKQKMRNFAK